MPSTEPIITDTISFFPPISHHQESTTDIDELKELVLKLAIALQDELKPIHKSINRIEDYLMGDDHK